MSTCQKRQFLGASFRCTVGVEMVSFHNSVTWNSNFCRSGFFYLDWFFDLSYHRQQIPLCGTGPISRSFDYEPIKLIQSYQSLAIGSVTIVRHPSLFCIVYHHLYSFYNYFLSIWIVFTGPPLIFYLLCSGFLVFFKFFRIDVCEMPNVLVFFFGHIFI